MSVKNLLDSTEKLTSMCDDKTGKPIEGTRMGVAETLQLVYDVLAKMEASDAPKVHAFASTFGVQQICRFCGWQPYEVAAADQYLQTMLTQKVTSTTG